MAAKEILWQDSGTLTIDYTGDGDGSAVFSSDVNEGVDREMYVRFVNSSRSVVVERSVSQAGRREIFNGSDGGFIIADGGTFNTLKQ